MGPRTVLSDLSGPPGKRDLEACDRDGYPALPVPEHNDLAPELVVGRYLFGWDDAVPRARLRMVPPGDDGLQSGECVVVASGTFSVMITTKALRASLCNGVITDNGQAKERVRVYNFVIPLVDIDYVEGDKSIAIVGHWQPKTVFESYNVFPASESWGVRIGWKAHHRTAEFNVAIANAVANAQVNSSDPYRSERAKRVLVGDLGTYSTRDGGTLEFGRRS